MRDWIYYKTSGRVWVEFGLTIDACKTVEMTEIQMCHAYLAMYKNFACGANQGKYDAILSECQCYPIGAGTLLARLHGKFKVNDLILQKELLPFLLFTEQLEMTERNMQKVYYTKQ